MKENRNDSKLYLILAIIWTAAAVLWSINLIVAISDGDKSEIALHAFCVVCYTFCAVINWITYYRRKNR